ncbi:MAG: hypothetical protein IMW90_09940 [Thermogemmatispora sp.]|nr:MULTISPECIES: hypothetical protein [Thermogemmatispora]MBE3566036.1 hypothetical protein [Thermogemmatispora sp.]
MYRYKGFDSAQCGDSISALEAAINAWMEAERPRIRHVCQSVLNNHILLSFVYEEMSELEQRLPAQAQTQAGSTHSRFLEDECSEGPPTNPQLPVIPPVVH